MTTSAAVFDESISRWREEQGLPWQKLKYKLVQAHLAKYIGPGELHILDAGGGNGYESIPLAAQGHRVEQVDYSSEMLADAARQAAAARVEDRVTLQQGDVREVARLFQPGQFDLVLCHNVIQYVEDAPALLKDLAGLLRAGGLISIVSINRYSVPYRTALPRGDLAQALAQLDARRVKAFIFDASFNVYDAEEIKEMLSSAGCAAEQDFGIRCIAEYWGDNELKSDPAIFAQLEELEFALAERYPYKLLARYFQVIARKGQPAATGGE